MQLKDAMSTELFCASPSDKVSEVAAMMKRHNVGAIPICENGRLHGIITDRDIVVECVAAGLDPQRCDVRQFTTVQPITASPSTDVKEAAEIMAKEQLRRLPVVDGDRLVGIFSLGDLAVHCSDDKLVADTLRRISIPVRSMKVAAAGA